mgnify:CR=1 FL=1
MALQIRQTMTAAAFDEWVRLPENSERRFERIAGEVVEVVSNALAARIAFRIGGFLFVYLQQHDIGTATGADGGYQVGGERYIPDVGFIRYERQTGDDTAAYYPAAPDLAVEVISNPRNETEMRDLRLKIAGYTAAGTTIWIVDPFARTVEVYQPGQSARTLDEDGTLDGGELLPGFQIRVGDVFPPEADV